MSEKVFTDIHVHGVPSQGMTMSHGVRRALLTLFAKQTGTQGVGPDAAKTFMEFLIHKLRNSRYVRRAVLLALDKMYDNKGVKSPVKFSFSVNNRDVLAWCRSAPDVLLFGASVHPQRPDALEALERYAEQGAVLVKWLPNSQNIDPTDHRYIPYYRKLIELGLPLLCHTGYEFALPVSDQSLGQFGRLRVPLELGVTVIAAHSGSSGIFMNRSSMKCFAQALQRYPNLYGETAALALPNRMGTLLWWRHHRELFNRLFFGTDFPVSFWAPVWRPFLARSDYIRFAKEKNPFDRMVLLLKDLGIHPQPDGFEELLGRMGRLHSCY